MVDPSRPTSALAAILLSESVDRFSQILLLKNQIIKERTEQLIRRIALRPMTEPHPLLICAACCSFRGVDHGPSPNGKVHVGDVTSTVANIHLH
jgi:hypothetical protein